MKIITLSILIMFGCRERQGGSGGCQTPSDRAAYELGSGAVCSSEVGGYVHCARNGQGFLCVDNGHQTSCVPGVAPSAEAK